MQVYISIPSWKNEKSLKLLREKCKISFNEPKVRLDKKRMKQIVKEYDGIIIGRLEIIDKEVLEGSNLKFIGVLAKGLDNVDIDEIKKRNIALFYTPEANISSVAEHVITLILSLAKNLIKLDKSVREEKFNEFRHSTIDIKDKTLGIIGVGVIAREVIKRVKAFGMNIICYTPNPKKHKDLDIQFVSLEELLKNSDFVSIHIPLNKETENFIDEKELNLMKPNAFLINTSRGKIVNEQALVKALKDNIISGAGIDVFEEEPTHNKELFKLDNLVLTPHVAGVSKNALNRMEEHIINDIVSFLEGKETKYRVV